LRVPDLNVLLNSKNVESPHHEAARTWLERALAASETVGFATLVVVGFIRISTRAPVFPQPLSVAEALDQVDNWFSSSSATTVNPGARHLPLLRSLLEHTGTAGNLTNDAHLAAMAIDHRATLATFDGDFHRFPGLKLEYLQ
jgi:toxin-antitoxin system PIN domain toxin